MAGDEVTIIEADDPRAVVLFCAGRGGNPSRHLPFLQTLAARGLTVVAPHFHMVPMAPPSASDLDGRIDIAQAALKAAAPGLPVIGIGHSIGTVVLLTMAGGKATTLAGETAQSGTQAFAKLFLLAPPTQFFRRPGALDGIAMPVIIRVGDQDAVTPPEQAQFLAGTLPNATLTIDAGAGHFTYMDELPPQISDPHPDRAGLLKALADEAARL